METKRGTKKARESEIEQVRNRMSERKNTSYSFFVEETRESEKVRTQENEKN